MPLIFTSRADRAVRLTALTVVAAGVLTVAGIWYYFTPKYTRVGYEPEQPVPFSHEQHVGQLGMNCLYCHNNVTDSPHANLPDAETCMNCHSLVKQNSPLLSPVRQSYEGGTPVPWKRVHKVPDYAKFNHAVHVKAGVSCASCHGKVNEMKVVYQAESQSMSWCLDCHRNPAPHIRPSLAAVLDLNEADHLTLEQRTDRGKKLIEQHKLHAPDNCQGCHR